MVMPAVATETVAASSMQAWSSTRRVAFRFACVYLTLYLIGEWLTTIPGLLWFGRQENRAWQLIATWTANHVLGFQHEIDLHRLGTGSGDSLLEYVKVFCQAVMAAAAATVWSLADRKRRACPALEAWLRVFVRYSLAYTMLGYGMAKVFPGQFGPPTLDRLP